MESQESSTSLAIDEFEVLAGDYVIPGSTIIEMMGFDAEQTTVRAIGDQCLVVEQLGRPICSRWMFGPKHWKQLQKVQQNESTPASEAILKMDFEEFLHSDFCQSLARAHKKALRERWSNWDKRRKLGCDKVLYTVRDFLEDFPDRDALKKIYLVGTLAADAFAHVCKLNGLPFKN